MEEELLNENKEEEELLKDDNEGKKISQKTEKDFFNILKLLAPGTSLRTALEDILRARMGALIVLDTDKLYEIMEKGFRLNSRFSAQKIVELAKMDGAIILSNDLKKILYANTLLGPSIQIPTKETGTRHKAAERTAIQMDTVCIAVSERKNKITLYCGNIRHELDNSSEVLRRAAETLQILEKQKELFNELMINLNLREVDNLVTISDVCEVLQRMEMVRRISEMVKKYLVELGKEGIIVSMRLKELIKNLEKEREMVLKDYIKKRYSKADNFLKNVNFDFLLEIQNLSRTLFEEIRDKSISPKGLRLLSKTSLIEKDVKVLVRDFKTLDKILNSDKKAITECLKSESVANSFIQDLESLKEKILLGKKI